MWLGTGAHLPRCNHAFGQTQSSRTFSVHRRSLATQYTSFRCRRDRARLSSTSARRLVVASAIARAALTPETWRRVRFDANGLVPAIVQEVETNQVLMLAYMNREALTETLRTGRAVFYSRSRQALWRKGDTSGQVQWVQELVFDCDMDTVLLRVKQTGVACHTGRYSCFWQRVSPTGQTEEALPVLIDPHTLYGRSTEADPVQRQPDTVDP
ncbi:hypothetical protein CCYA_CCYA05G1495 [Cyanidiococcus yangmingshanensis]|nr:hypothetical protein CCYA_CCYA05G1495 [Cyanidiococcus yangmingshanensis]